MTELIGTSPPLVLVVEDDPGARMLTVASLKKAGYATVEAADGADGISAFGRFRPDLILMDAVMPGMDGFAAIREIRNRPGGGLVPILMMTGLENLVSIQRAYEVGATDFATKPLNWVILGHRVGYLLRSSRAFLDLAANEEKTRALLRAIPDRIFRIGADGTVLDLVAGQAHVGILPDHDWAGRKLPEVLPAEAAAEAMRHAGTACRTGRIQMFEYAIHSGAKSRSFEARIVSIPDGESLFIARDVTDRKKAEERLAYMAYHDPLTDLPNGAMFNDRLVRDLVRAKRWNEIIGVALVDLDRFRHINETFGHAVGDRLLVAVAERLQGAVRGTDTVARMSGDEFSIILPDLDDDRAAIKAGQRLHHVLDAPFLLEGREMKVTASMGISLFPFCGDTPEVLVKQAEIAMFRAKAQGRDTLHVFREGMNDAVDEGGPGEKETGLSAGNGRIPD